MAAGAMGSEFMDNSCGGASEDIAVTECLQNSQALKKKDFHMLSGKERPHGYQTDRLF